MLLENGEYALAAEVKSALTAEDVKTHTERICILRAYADAHKDTRQYLGGGCGENSRQAGAGLCLQKRLLCA